MKTTHDQAHDTLSDATLTVILEKARGNWGAHAPDLEDAIIATGDTREEAIHNFRDALLDLFDFKREQGRAVPQITALEVREIREIETLEVREAVAA